MYILSLHIDIILDCWLVSKRLNNNPWLHTLDGFISTNVDFWFARLRYQQRFFFSYSNPNPCPPPIKSKQIHRIDREPNQTIKQSKFSVNEFIWENKHNMNLNFFFMIMFRLFFFEMHSKIEKCEEKINFMKKMKRDRFLVIIITISISIYICSNIEVTERKFTVINRSQQHTQRIYLKEEKIQTKQQIHVASASCLYVNQTERKRKQ